VNSREKRKERSIHVHEIKEEHIEVIRHTLKSILYNTREERDMFSYCKEKTRKTRQHMKEDEDTRM
jgi:hypothetical protein